jgi:ubiquinone/menaquinone biosynthesis C-methylase UbiE
MIERLLLASGLGRRRRALDLCCGTGQAASALAPHFESVLAVDQEAEMVAAGRDEAALSGPSNVAWAVARAEELAITPGTLDLISIANAFHRVRRVGIARRAARWLRPGGVFVDMGSSTVLTGPEPWHAVVSEVIRRWRPSVAAAAPNGAPRSAAEVLTEAGLVMVDDQEIPMPRRWTLDELVGFAFSTSGASPAAMGASAAGFEADLRSSLLELDPAGTYDERIAYYFRIARREAR